MSRGIWGELYHTNRDGVIVEDLSRSVLAGSIEYSAQRSGATPLLGRFTLSKADVLEPLRDFVRPYLVIQEEGKAPRRWQMGIYSAVIPSERHWLNRAEPTYELRDLTELLARGGSNEPREIASGANVVTALTDLAGLAGLTRLAYPNSARTTGFKRTHPAGVNFLEQGNKLCEAVGWYPQWMGLDGKLTTRPSQLLSETTPLATITTDDPVDVVTVNPTDPAAVYNIVVVTKDRADADPLEAVRINDDPGSPTSTVNIGPRIYGGGPHEASEAETQDDVDALADRLFEQARSYERTITLKVHPNPRLLGMWRTLELDIETVAGANLRGRYWINGWQVGFTPGQAAMSFTLNRLVRFGRGEDR